MSGAVAKIGSGAANLTRILVPKLRTAGKYLAVEMKPPTPGEFGQVAQGFRNIIAGFGNGRYKQLTVKEAWLNTLITMEIVFFFFFGEVIGRRHFPGYLIPAHPE